MNANDKQVGGNHYKRGGEEHWDRIWRLYGRGYFIGCITKYVERYQYKNGLEDLAKAEHFLQKLMELERGNVPPAIAYQEAKWPLPGAHPGPIQLGEEPGPGYVDQDRPLASIKVGHLFQALHGAPRKCNICGRGPEVHP